MLRHEATQGKYRVNYYADFFVVSLRGAFAGDVAIPNHQKMFDGFICLMV